MTSSPPPPATRTSASAIDALDGALGLSRPGAARLLVIISDGQYKDTQHADGQARITRLAAAGCGILWLAPDQPGNQPMTGARVITLADPAATTAAIAPAATRALHAPDPPGGRGSRPSPPRQEHHARLRPRSPVRRTAATDNRPAPPATVPLPRLASPATSRSEPFTGWKERTS